MTQNNTDADATEFDPNSVTVQEWMYELGSLLSANNLLQSQIYDLLLLQLMHTAPDDVVQRLVEGHKQGQTMWTLNES